MDSLSAELWEMGTAGIVEELKGLRAFFADSVTPAAICAKLELPEARVEGEEPFDMSRGLPIDGDPVLIGQRFYVAPSWVTSPVPPTGRLRLTIDATSAFGSGRHETTQMCVEVLEKYLRPGDWVADIGCGSGILSAAAGLLGAGAVFSCDIHEESVRCSRALIQTPMFVGSADGLRSNLADLVLANISARILDVIANDLKRVAKPEGLIVMAGFIEENPPKNFRPWEVLKKGGWPCWICRRSDVLTLQNSSEPAVHDQQWWL